MVRHCVYTHSNGEAIKTSVYANSVEEATRIVLKGAMENFPIEGLNPLLEMFDLNIRLHTPEDTDDVEAYNNDLGENLGLEEHDILSVDYVPSRVYDADMLRITQALSQSDAALCSALEEIYKLKAEVYKLKQFGPMEVQKDGNLY